MVLFNRARESCAADLDLVAVAAEFLETDVSSRGPVYDLRGNRAVMAFDGLRLLVKVQIMNQLSVELHLQASSLEADLVACVRSLAFVTRSTKNGTDRPNGQRAPAGLIAGTCRL